MTLRTDARKVAVLVLASWFAILGCNGLTSPDIDADRDGFTADDGDCDDNNASVRPGADFDFYVDFAYAGTVHCNTPNQQAVYRVANNSCSTLTVMGLTRSLEMTCSDSVQPNNATRNPALNGATSVAPGEIAVIRTGLPANSTTVSCGGSRNHSCAIIETFTVTTSAGVKSTSNGFTVRWDSSCQRCLDWQSPTIIPPLSSSSRLR